MKLSKVLSIILVTIMAVAVLANVAYAIDPSTITPVTTGDGATSVKTMGEKIIGIIQVVGSVIAVAILVVLGIKYMMGSAEEKAEYKKTLIPYFVGAILIFAASNVAGIVYDMANNLKP